MRGRTSALGPQDAAEIARIWTFDGYDEARIAWELETPEQHVWRGLRDADGRVVAAHRGLVWHRHLLLKGICLDPTAAGATASLTLALAMRDEALSRGLSGVAAWVEPHRPEAHLAHRLRLEPATTLVHRFLVPAADAGSHPAPAPILSGVVEMPSTQEPLLTPGLPGAGSPDTGDVTRVAWLLDRDRLLVAGVPTGSRAGLTTFLAELAERAGVRPRAFEVPLPAADLVATLGLTRSGAHRLSRTPVRLALSRDAAATPSARIGG